MCTTVKPEEPRASEVVIDVTAEVVALLDTLLPSLDDTLLKLMEYAANPPMPKEKEVEVIKEMVEATRRNPHGVSPMLELPEILSTVVRERLRAKGESWSWGAILKEFVKTVQSVYSWYQPRQFGGEVNPGILDGEPLPEPERVEDYWTGERVLLVLRPNPRVH